MNQTAYLPAATDTIGKLRSRLSKFPRYSGLTIVKPPLQNAEAAATELVLAEPHARQLTPAAAGRRRLSKMPLASRGERDG
jgi:hypothetical protein